MNKLTKHIPWLFMAGLYGPVFWTLYMGTWESLDYTHAYFILPISIALAFRKRGQIKSFAMSNEPSSLNSAGFTFLALGLALFLLGYRHDYMFITSFSLIPVLCGLILYLYGAKMMRLLLFPVLYLLMMVPIPSGILDNITLPMRYLSSIVSAGA